MKKTFKDRLSDALLIVIRPLGTIWMRFDMKIKIFNDGVNFKRKEPYVLLGNHVYEFDVVELARLWKITPVIVSSQLLLTVKGLKFLLKHVAKTIPKSKGEADLRTAKALIRSVKKGYPILIFPEGDSTFFGETGHIEYSTAKLIKKLKVDVIAGIFEGGFLGKPRWAFGKRKNRRVDLHVKPIIPKEKIPDLSVDDIYEIICNELYHNDYEWQRKTMHSYGGKNLTEGITNIIYCCPECESLNTLVAKGNEIECIHCNTKGYMDDYGFIHGFKYDNLLDWNKFQRTQKDRLTNSHFKTTGTLVYVDLEAEKRNVIGQITLEYKNNEVIMGGVVQKSFKIDEMLYPVITMMRNFSFEFDGVYYMIKLDNHAMSFLRICQDKY